MERIPSELIAGIFEHLTYFDLKLNVPLVCKRFKHILEDASNAKHGVIAKTLCIDKPTHDNPFHDIIIIHFRDKNAEDDGTKSTKPTQQFSLHPVLSKLKLEHDEISRPGLENFLLNGRPINEKDNILFENLISPALGRGYAYAYDYVYVRASNQRCLCIRDVIKALTIHMTFLLQVPCLKLDFDRLCHWKGDDVSLEVSDKGRVHLYFKF